ncbi:MAG: hypothetical protein ACRD4F_12035 [Candidatus Angelobacter sp.]
MAARSSAVEQGSGFINNPPEAPSAPLGSAAGTAPFASSGQIQWKQYLSTAWPLAILAGLITGFLPPIGILICLPLTVVIAIRFYLKHHPGPLQAGQAAKLGMAAGVISFFSFAPVFAAVVTFNARIHQQLLDAMTQAAARNPDPQAQQIMKSLIETSQGFALLIAVSLILFFFIILAFTGITGAISAALIGNKAR